MNPARKLPKPPEIQLIANAVITDGRGRVLLTRYDADDAERWWLPGTDPSIQRASATLISADGIGRPVC